MREHSPTLILPSTLAPAPISTLSPIFGCRSPFSLPLPPSVTACRNEQLSPTDSRLADDQARRVIEHDAFAEMRCGVNIDSEHARRLALQIEREVAASALP